MNTNMSRKGRSRGLITLVVLLALVAASCGDGDGADDTTTTTSADSETPTTMADDGEETTTTTEASSEEAGEPVRLVYASFAAQDSPYSQAFAWIADELNARTDGRVTIEQFHSGALCAFDEMIECLRDGRTDFSLFLPVQSPADFPYSSIGSVLFVSRDTWAHGEAFNELVVSDDRFAEEWEAQGMAPLWFASIGPAVLGANEPVENLEWLDGKSIRSTGYFTDALNAVGANPVAMPNSDVYESIQRGVIDAFYASTLDGAALDNSHFEVTSHWQDLGAGEYVTIATATSQTALDKLTQEEQDILFELTAQVQEDFFSEYYLPLMDVACDNAIEGGLESLTIWPDDEVERFRNAAADTIRDQWIADTEATGATGAAEVFDTFVQTVSEKEADSPLEATATELCAERFASS